MAHKVAKSSNSWFNWASEDVESPYPEDRESPYSVNEVLECNNFLGVSQQRWESVALPVVALLAFVYAYPRLHLPVARSCACPYQELVGRRILLLLLCLVFGIELGVKLALRRVFWIDKPGYLATLFQIFMLVAPPSRIMTAVFRLQMHMLFGIPVVVFFPLVNIQSSLIEVVISFIQHVLMLVITFYLMCSGDPYIPEPLGDFSWACIAFVLLFLYHFLPLHLLTYVSQVNVNGIYPHLLGPGQSKFYYLLILCHQLILIPTFGKLLVIIAKAFNILPCSSSLDVKDEKCSKPVRSCCIDSCPGHTCKYSSASGRAEEYNTDEDSGCVGSCSQLNTGSCSPLNTGSCSPLNTGSCKPLKTGSCKLLNTGTCKLLNTGSCKLLSTGSCKPLNTGFCKPLNTGSCSPLNTGYRRYSRGSTQGSCSKGYRSPCRSPHRSFLNDHKENWLSSSPSVHTRHIVNGELINRLKVDDVPRRRWAKDTTSHTHGKSPLSGTGQNSSKKTMCRSFLLSDSQQSSPEVSIDRSIHALDLEASRNSYAKSH
ncbi:hypothetical protein BsWGS_03806 [Bradybaena similaris]